MARPKKLTDQMSAFVDAWLNNGNNGAAAALQAGYKGSHKVLATTAARLLKKEQVLEAIKERTVEPEEGDGIATRDERRRFWTEVMQGKQYRHIDRNGRIRTSEAPMKDRLKASELLGKSFADFKEVVEVKETFEVVLFEIPSNGRDAAGED